MEKIGAEGKYAYETGTIMLPVIFDRALPEEVTIDGLTCFRKSEFHVSLVCVEKIIEKYAPAVPEFKKVVIREFEAFTEEHDLSEVRYRPEFRQAIEGGGVIQSVLIMCEVPGLAKFFELLNKKYNLTLETQPTHVSLYTIPEGSRGVFLIDSEDIRKLTKPLAPPISWPA